MHWLKYLGYTIYIYIFYVFCFGYPVIYFEEFIMDIYFEEFSMDIVVSQQTVQTLIMCVMDIVVSQQTVQTLIMCVMDIVVSQQTVQTLIMCVMDIVVSQQTVQTLIMCHGYCCISANSPDPDHVSWILLYLSKQSRP